MTEPTGVRTSRMMIGARMPAAAAGSPLLAIARRLGLAVLVLLVTGIGGLFGAGVAFRARTIQAGPAMQLPIFAVLFLAPVYVPRELLQSWIRTAADFNPFTPIVEAGRHFLAGTPADTLAAFGLGAAMVALMLAFALRGLRKAEAAGG